MKYLESYKLFESKKFREGDVVRAYYWATQEPAIFKIIEWKNGNLCSVQLCDKFGVVLHGTKPFPMKKSELFRDDPKMIQSVQGPVTYRNPANIPADFIRKDVIRMSNDIAHYGVF